MLGEKLAVAMTAFAICAIAADRLAAHAGPRSTEPLDGATLGATPAIVRLTFTEKPEASLSSIRVLDTSGGSHQTGRPEYMPDDPMSLFIRVNPLEPGVYIVHWRVVSAVDGHATEGSYAFGVRVAPTGVTTGAPATSSSASPIEMLARWMFLVGVVLALGASASSVARFGGARDLHVGLAGCLLAGGGVLLLAAAQAQSAAASIGALLSASIGRALVWRASAVGGAAIAFAIAWWKPAHRGTAMSAAALAAMAAAGVHVAAGHAGAGRGWTLVSGIAGQWIHFVAVGVWLGGLATLLVGVRGIASAEKAIAVRRFSEVAVCALAIVVVTGTLRAVAEVASWNDLFTTTYGRTVLLKIGLIAGIAALAALNRWRSVPFAASNLRPLRMLGSGELAVTSVALVASAMLGALPPPAAGIEAIREVVATGTDFGTTVNVTLKVSSDLPGPNRFVVTATDYDSRAPVDARRISLRFVPLDDPGVPPSTLTLEAEPDRTFTGSGSQLAFDGRWGVTALIERGGDSTEVALEIEARGRPQFLSIERPPGEPAKYSVQVIRAGFVRFTPLQQHVGRSVVNVEFFDVVQDHLATDEVVVTHRAGDADWKQLAVRRVGPHRFEVDADFQAGVNTFAAVGRTVKGARLRAALALTIP